MCWDEETETAYNIKEHFQIKSKCVRYTCFGNQENGFVFIVDK